MALGDASAGIVGIHGGFNRGEGALRGHVDQFFGGRVELCLRFVLFALLANLYGWS
jgi:hypothetical protein